MGRYQTPKDKKVKRSDHVWIKDKDAGHFKCVLCGAITKAPPDFPTAADWVADKYEPLTDKEREMCPYTETVKAFLEG